MMQRVLSWSLRQMNIRGFGECSPYMSINGESIDTCFIVGQYLAKVLKGKGCTGHKRLCPVDEQNNLW